MFQAGQRYHPNMDAQNAIEYQWPYVLSLLPPNDQLERSAKEMGALRRKRGVRKASDLLRLALVYSLCGFSLRQTAAWAQVSGVAELSDVALLNRLRGASGWLGHLVAVKLAERAPPPPPSSSGDLRRLRLVDATCISRPGSSGTDWRVHLGFDLARVAIDSIELTEVSGGETLTRFDWAPNDVVLGDRGYAHRRGFHAVVDAGADFIVRLNWQNVPLLTADGMEFDVLHFLRQLPDATVRDSEVFVAPSKKPDIPSFPARVVAIRKSEPAAAEARKKVLQERSRKSRQVDPRTLEAAGYLFVLTSLSAEQLSAADVLRLYRFRWQIELAFKRMKSLLALGDLPARDPPLARAFIYGKLLAALLLEDLTERFLDFSPWGYRLGEPSSFPLANPAGSG